MTKSSFIDGVLIMLNEKVGGGSHLWATLFGGR